MVTTAGVSGLTSFLAWWGEELAAMVPRVSLERRTPDVPLLLLESGGLRLLEGERGKRRGGVSGAPLPLPLMLDVLVGKLSARQLDGPIGIRVPASMCFRRNIEIPEAARNSLPAMLAIDLERSTPFKAAEVLSGFDFAGKPARPGMVNVRNYVLKRKSVEPVADAIERLGLAVCHVEVAPEGDVAPVRLWPASALAQRRPRKRPAAMLNLVLAAAVLGLCVLPVHLTVDRHEKALVALQQTTASLRAKAQARMASASQAEGELSSLASYAKLRAEYVSRASILEELTRILPDTAWVADLKIDAATLSISGQAKSATALLPLIEASPYFVDATLTTSVTFDPREERERYSINARIRGMPSDQQASREGAQP